MMTSQVGLRVGFGHPRDGDMERVSCAISLMETSSLQHGPMPG
jgi:hypothetical protein